MIYILIFLKSPQKHLINTRTGRQNQIMPITIFLIEYLKIYIASQKKKKSLGGKKKHHFTVLRCNINILLSRNLDTVEFNRDIEKLVIWHGAFKQGISPSAPLVGRRLRLQQQFTDYMVVSVLLKNKTWAQRKSPGRLWFLTAAFRPYLHRCWAPSILLPPWW